MDIFFELLVSGIALGGLYSGMALGIVILTKASKIFNFAHGELAVIGAYAVWAFGVQFNLPYYLIPILLFALIAGLAFLIERMVLRPMIGQPILSIILVTLAIGQVLSGLVTLIWPGTGRVYPELIPPTALNLLGVNVALDRCVTSLIAIAMFGIFLLFFQFTKMGLAMRATAEDPQLSQSRGIRVTKMYAYCWFIAILTASVVGMLLATTFGVERIAIEDFSLKSFVVVILGGFESIGGVLIAGFALGIIESLVAGYLDGMVGGGLSELMPFLVMLLVLIVKPYGLYGYVRIERV
jgi:branched-chain amino acid transport system permease protein